MVTFAPVTLDTPGNRAAMPDADISTWTPLDVVAEKFEQWIRNGDAKNGVCYHLKTEGGRTDFVEEGV